MKNVNEIIIRPIIPTAYLEQWWNKDGFFNKELYLKILKIKETCQKK